jgi:hypothetical protein
VIKLKNLLLEYQQALLTDSPAQLYFTKKIEGTHIEIIKRLYPKEMEELTNKYIDMGYDEDDKSAAYEAANDIANRKNIARITIENNKLYFNTFKHRLLSNNQLSFLKNYCIENNLKLFHSMTGRLEKEVDLMEKLQ